MLLFLTDSIFIKNESFIIKHFLKLYTEISSGRGMDNKDRDNPIMTTSKRLSKVLYLLKGFLLCIIVKPRHKEALNSPRKSGLITI